MTSCWAQHRCRDFASRNSLLQRDCTATTPPLRVGRTETPTKRLRPHSESLVSMQPSAAFEPDRETQQSGHSTDKTDASLWAGGSAPAPPRFRPRLTGGRGEGRWHKQSHVSVHAARTDREGGREAERRDSKHSRLCQLGSLLGALQVPLDDDQLPGHLAGQAERSGCRGATKHCGEDRKRPASAQCQSSSSIRRRRLEA